MGRILVGRGNAVILEWKRCPHAGQREAQREEGCPRALVTESGFRQVVVAECVHSLWVASVSSWNNKQRSGGVGGLKREKLRDGCQRAGERRGLRNVVDLLGSPSAHLNLKGDLSAELCDFLPLRTAVWAQQSLRAIPRWWLSQINEHSVGRSKGMVTMKDHRNEIGNRGEDRERRWVRKDGRIMSPGALSDDDDNQVLGAWSTLGFCTKCFRGVCVIKTL